MTSLKPDLLKKQLFALFLEEENRSCLTPHPFLKRRIYAKGTLAGRACRIIGIGRNQDALLERRVSEIKDQILIYFKMIVPACREFEKSLSRLIRAKDPEGNYQKAREDLTLWSDTVAFPLRLLKRKEHPSFEEIFQSDAFERIKFYQAIIDLEESTEYAIPFPLLLKLSLGEELEKSEERKIKAWIDHLKECKNKKVFSIEGWVDNRSLMVRRLHRMLYTLTHFINSNKKLIHHKLEDRQASLATLEGRLWERGCDILSEIDEKLIKKRASLTGTTIEYKGEEVTIGKCIQNEENDSQLPMVFEIEELPHHIVISYSNEAQSFLDEFKEKYYHSGIILQNVFLINRYGESVVAERLEKNLVDIKWEANSCELNKTDRENADPVVLLVKRCLALAFTPFPFHPRCFGYALTSDGYFLRSRICLFQVPKSFEILNDFFWETSQGNPFIYFYFMTKSGLHKTEEAKAYHTLFEYAVKGVKEKKAVTLNQSISEEGNEDLLKNREVFFKDVKAIQKSCMQHLQEFYEIPNRFDLGKEVRNKMLDYHKKEFPGCILPDYFVDTIVQRILHEHCFELKKTNLKEKTALLLVKLSEEKFDFETESFYAHGIYDPKQIQYANEKLKANAHLFKD